MLQFGTILWSIYMILESKSRNSFFNNQASILATCSRFVIS